MTHAMPERRALARTGVIAALTALAALGTLLIRIPIPATTGYFNIGDVFVVLAGLWLGPLAGLIVGAIGPAVADAIGFPQFILATAVTKGCEGLVVGLIGGGARKMPTWRRGLAATCGGVIVVVGYFVFEAIVYPRIGAAVPFFAVTDIGAAMVELLPNSVQAFIGAFGGLALWKTVSRSSG